LCCSGAQIRSPRPEAVNDGVHLGTAIKSGLATQDSFSMDVFRNARRLMNPAVDNVTSEAQHHVPSVDYFPDSLCDREWHRPCPDGWRSYEDVCVAPSTYDGGCARRQPQGAFSTAQQKASFAERCKSPWSCKSDTCQEGRVYDECPHGWSVEGSWCSQVVPSDCPVSVFDMFTISVAEKQQLGLVCGAQWKCRNACLRDYEQLCPQGWQNVETTSVCLASPSYSGKCPLLVNTSKWSSHEKQAFETNCDVSFPCKVSDVDAI